VSDTSHKIHETICIECKYQCSHRCSWAWEFVPVPGWTAIETKTGYDVYECPHFVKGRGLPRSGFDTDGVIACLQALMERTKDDYIRGVDLNVNEDGVQTRGKDKSRRKRTRKSFYYEIENAAEIRAANRKRIEAWIRGDGQKMMMLSDPEAVIDQLRRFAKKYEAERAEMDRRINWRLRP